jgi:hypothetical protein
MKTIHGIGAAALLLGLSWGCESKPAAPACPDVLLQEGCTARCARTEAGAGGAQRICTKQLLLSSHGTNDILKSDTKTLKTQKLPQELCFDLTDGKPPADVLDKLRAACPPGGMPASAPSN